MPYISTVSFKKDPEKSIDNTIKEINSIARKFIAFNPLIELIVIRD